MTRDRTPALAFCALAALRAAALAQNGPDNDADGLPGYVNNAFHHASVDSINLYNGQLTVPIALGPSYPAGPRLRVQLAMTYNSRVWEYGHPGSSDPLFTYTPLAGDPSLGLGWTMTLGAIKTCPEPCFVGPDGSRHIFDEVVNATDYKTSDASPLYLRRLPGSAGWRMWDGDGNRYEFTWQVDGFDDDPLQFTRDFGRGRDGWYATSVTDPFGNAYSVDYFDTAADGFTHPCWGYLDGRCAAWAHMVCAPPGVTHSWIVKRVRLPGGAAISVHLDSASRVASIDFPVLVNGASTYATWTMSYDSAPAAWPCAYETTSTIQVARLTKISLPAGIAGAPAHRFSYGYTAGATLTHLDLPTGGSVDYCYSSYTFFHGRIAALPPGCGQQTPPPNDPDAVVQVAACATASPDDAAPTVPPDIPGPCNPNSPPRWIDAQLGVTRRTERVSATAAAASTTYTQYAFPWGERGSPSDTSVGSQTLTVAVTPPDADGHSVAKATLFWSGPKVPASASYNGDRVGADIEERVFDLDPNAPGVVSMPACGPLAAPEQPFCASKAVRVTTRTYAYDLPSGEIHNRRLVGETTYYDHPTTGGSCTVCPYHAVAYSNLGADTWEGNGRHFDVESHSGNLGGDARTVTTVWAPSGWSSGPAGGAAVLPNLASRRTAASGGSVRDEYLENDPATGFLRGSFDWDPIRQSAVTECRFADGHGNAGKQFTRTVPGFPSRTYCADTGFPSMVGHDGDTFGKVSTWQNGELLATRWVDGTIATPTFSIRDVTRDSTTGWITASRTPAGLATGYRYDALGRVTTVDPPGTPPAAGAELSTFVCYESPTATTAYRASAAQACPVAPGNPAIATWEHYDFDGLGRRIRQRHLLPGAMVSKRFTLYDGPGRAYFESEWVADATSEALSRNLSTACVFASAPLWPTARASAAPGTLRLCHDPFGRPQQVVGSKHSSLVTVDRSDSGHPYSDVSEKTKTYCVNAPFTNLQQAACGAGGLNPETTSRRDAFGRLVQVAEPTGDVTAYGRDVGGALLSVSQGIQSRTFQRDASGRVRVESTPEAGSATMDAVGSLGNVNQETRGGVVVSREFDFAGRPTRVIADGLTYVVQCWDGAPTCVDGSPGHGGGSYPAGRLTRRYGFNRIPTIGPVADEKFEYSGGGGRLSRLITALGNGDLAASASQSWTYDNLGLPASHDHPRVFGSFPVSTAYSASLPASLTANGQTVVAATTWNAASGLASWTAGNSGTPVTVTIAPDPSLLPRPASISSPVWSSGAYAYDGAGDVLSIGADAYHYDARERLTSAKYGSVTRTFAYDRWGNLTANGPTPIPIDPTTNRIVGAGYDSRGDMTASGAEAMSWDGLARQYRNTNAASDWIHLRTGGGERIARFPAKLGVLRREMARYVAEANVIAKGWTLPACAGTFADVPCSDPDARYVQLAYDRGVTGGCATNPLQFCPDAGLTRAQMAVFLVKGYEPPGFTPPACQGLFQDVTCGGPYAAFAPWIEQLYRDGVTAGCATNPLRYCPGNPVGEWEVLVWLAKAPGTLPGTTLWSAYHPVPRGTTYTWRDENGRVVTEASGGSSGASSATLTVARDNVFLGNLLVASYVASPPGWQYTVSDHLGSPRAVFNQSGQLVETHKHWPYGEDTTAAPPAQRLSFCLMERDGETTRYSDHARTHDYQLGRFLSPDSVGGRPENPQSWNRYAYTLGNPLKYVDPDGRLTILVHGTWANGKADFLPGGRFYEYVKSTVPDRAYASFQWSGKNNHAARMEAARKLADFINHYKFAPGEQLNVGGHSHGGNVDIMAINLGLKHKVDNLITLGTPSRPEYRLIRPGDVSNWVNVYNSYDGVQTRGGGDAESPMDFGPAARTHPYALNIDWNVDFGPIESHERLHTPPAWDFALPHLNLRDDHETRVFDYVIN